MPLCISSINSGSNGNCYYVGNEHDAVLIDAGISCRETERRMQRMGLTMHRVRAIFISHEHTDHTRGAEVISRKYRIPVYVTAATHDNSRLNIIPHLLRHFTSHETVQAGELSVLPFPKRHDATDPHSFTVSFGDITVGVMTDIGSSCEHLIHHFSRCHAAFLEANYDEKMLEEGCYPAYLKKRIRSDEGHLSNSQALELFLNHRHPQLSHLLLSHLSQENNHPGIARDLFMPHANGTYIEVASRHEPSGVFCVHGPAKDKG